MVKDFPMSQNPNHPTSSSTRSAFAPRSKVRTNTGKETLRQGRVLALVPRDVQNIESVLLGIIPICAQNAYVLIDSGSIHSFVSHAFSKKLTRPLEAINYFLSVDLLPLDIDHFDCILGMNWLTKYHATIDCVTKSVMFRPPELPEFVFARNGVVFCYENSVDMKTIPIVSEFPDVFPNDLPGDLIDREIEFTIEILYHPGNANTVANALSRKSIRNLACLLTGQKELLCDLERNEIEIILHEQGGVLAAISAQPAIIEEVKEKATRR
ncbi:uncharacterized protein LOC114306926 [Camellia sinensis]|uniref:uncharacterized protein LOC114306926 n=1 Tax=Camellia sinensis TaxID=4442 RepID=UPI0010363587|nr:uncharacterized protein LOC114306926 [Camellia sinensis]